MRTFRPLPASRRGWQLISCLGAVTFVAVGCGDLAENLVEEGIEQAIEADSGEDIELDFDGEDGITIETEDGTMTIDGDGSFTVEGEDGEVLTGESTEDGFTVTNEDGSEVLEIGEDDGTVSAETEDGTFTAGPGMPEDWPGLVPMPNGLSDLNGSSMNADGQEFISVTGTAAEGAVMYFESYSSALEGAGYERTSYFEGEGIRQGTFEGADYSVTVVSNEDASNVGITIITAAG